MIDKKDMTDLNTSEMNIVEKDNHTRPEFPERAIVTAGMPYGNKELHLGHIGGVFIHADTYARFLRDRIGKDNVIFVSGTDCYGSPILENYRQIKERDAFEGTLEDFVRKNHNRQKETLEKYKISTNLFAASGLGREAEIHKEFSEYFINQLYNNGHLEKMTTSQFYDTEFDVFLNGRQVVGQCPIAGCNSERGYADECALGHQYMPSDLINPKSTLSGKKPEMRGVTNWYFRLDKFHKLLSEWVEKLDKTPGVRNFVIKSVGEFLEPPVIYVKREFKEVLEGLIKELPACTLKDEENKPSLILMFRCVEDREKACGILSLNNIRFRTGKTLVPFRLTGNIEWGVKAPVIEGLENLTIWVWPESLWAPVSFTCAYLEKAGKSTGRFANKYGDYDCNNNKDCEDLNDYEDLKILKDCDAYEDLKILKARNNWNDRENQKDCKDWKDWWCSEKARVYQFIGEDNVYFYGPVEMAMFMGTQGTEPVSSPETGQFQLPSLIVNNHLLFLDKKASSSGNIKPPTADELLDYYTAEQLRAHFLGLGLGIRSVGFQPKPLNPKANERDADPVLKEGNLLSNVFNRAVRSCFYTAQKYSDCIIPYMELDSQAKSEAKAVALEYEKLMYRCEFHQMMNLMDSYIRNINKYWSKNMKEAESEGNTGLIHETLANAFHMVRTAAVLMHPVAPEGTSMILEYLQLDERFWDWKNIFEPVYFFMNNPVTHKLKFLEPRVDFFAKHPSQLDDKR